MKRTIWVDTKSRVAIILIRRARARGFSLNLSRPSRDSRRERDLLLREFGSKLFRCLKMLAENFKVYLGWHNGDILRVDSTRPRKPWTNRVFQIFFVFFLVFSWLIYFILFCDTYSVAKREPKNEGVTTSVLCAHVIPVGSGLFSHV